MKFWGLGNLAIIYPLIHNIKQRFPDAKLTFLTFDLNKDFLEKNASIDRLIYFKYTKNIFMIIRQTLRFIIRFRKEKIDMVINFETFNNTSAVFSYLTKAPLRFGLNNQHEEIFYTDPVCNEQSEHISRTFLKLILPLVRGFSYNYFNFSGSFKDKVKVEDILKRYGIDKYVCIHAGSSDNFTKKRYRKGYFSRIAELLIKNHGLNVIFTGTEKESGLVKEIIAMIPHTDKVFNFSGKLKIWEFIELLRKSSLFICNDSGPIHIAASLQINVAGIYGPTSPDRYGPLNKNSLVFYKNNKCSPCFGINYINKRCRNNFSCLDFQPQEIFSKIAERFLNA
ncbi:MAG: glycosyltransferase family 9 protein [Candidatus Omnitrophota bacterium]|nr:glycosyltransferase family 9 protein [Candidatus Omnitrophota bacterium]